MVAWDMGRAWVCIGVLALLATGCGDDDDAAPADAAPADAAPADAAPHHPYFIAAQFHPELTSRPLHPQPMFMGLLAAAIERKYPGQASPSDPAAADLARWTRRGVGQPVA